MKTLSEGDKAPAFKGRNQDGKEISLSDFQGKKVVLYFYPKDNTPGCTAEACNLNDHLEDFTGKGFVVIGISPDSESSHQRFISKYGLKFQLISDTDKTILNDYGTWGEKNMYGKVTMGVLRTTFIINEKGYIEKIIRKVDTKDHANQIFATLSATHQG